MILRDIGDDEAFYRFIVPRWSHAPTSGAGAVAKGGRFNRPGLEALYLSRSAETALAEYQQDARLLPPGTLALLLVTRLRVVDFSAGYKADNWHPLWAEYACNWRNSLLTKKWSQRAGYWVIWRWMKMPTVFCILRYFTSVASIW